MGDPVLLTRMGGGGPLLLMYGRSCSLNVYGGGGGPLLLMYGRSCSLNLYGGGGGPLLLMYGRSCSLNPLLFHNANFGHM